jgi:hypothetical protein
VGSWVSVTEVRPARVSDVAPSDIAVVPTVTELLLNAAFGMPVKLVPVRVGVVEKEGVVPPTRTPEAVATNAVVLAAVW